ncbi:NAD(+)/NADH kinase [Acinetobacter sp.]|uniref:NAD(+)/NADH kinase n=1 Tax=Acinetobacter sp. TaxID=472 RepID=UPI003752428A
MNPVVIVDEYNPKAIEAAKQFKNYKFDDANMILVLGGDGTMVRAIQKFYKFELPFYGINYGHLGFLLNDNTSLPKQYACYNLPLLRTTWSGLDGSCGEAVGVNDIWVERASAQTAKMMLLLDGVLTLPRVYADGLLVCTPQGSTAYARAMGGVPLPIDTQAMQIVGNNVGFPTWKSALLGLDQSVEIINTCNQTGKRPIRLLSDGVVLSENIHSVKISRLKTHNITLFFDTNTNLASKITAIQFPKK